MTEQQIGEMLTVPHWDEVPWYVLHDLAVEAGLEPPVPPLVQVPVLPDDLNREGEDEDLLARYFLELRTMYRLIPRWDDHPSMEVFEGHFYGGPAAIVWWDMRRHNCLAVLQNLPQYDV